MSRPEDAGLLVVGAGHAAVQLVTELRDGGYAPAITLVSEDSRPPYQRPPLSKSFLKTGADDDLPALRAAAFYDDYGVRLLTGERVESVDLGAAGGGSAACRSGRQIRFGRLVLATGARPRHLPVPGAAARGVHVLRTADDANRLRAELLRADDVVVLGGGFIGLEVAATACDQGKRVTVVEAADSVLGRAVGTRTGQHVRLWHERAGVRFRLATSATRIVARDGQIEGVELSDGSWLRAQVVVVGIGAEPRTGLAEQAGLRCADGILVDKGCVASDGSTLAIGDCARAPDLTGGSAPGATRRLESVDNAVEQARAAAATILGRPHVPRTVPWFWSDQGSLKLQIAGLRAGGDEPVVREDGSAGRLTTLYYRDGDLVAAETVNAPADAMFVRRALERGISLPRALAEDATRPVNELVRQ